MKAGIHERMWSDLGGTRKGILGKKVERDSFVVLRLEELIR